RMAVACSITGRSDADPHRIPTTGPAASATLLLHRPKGDVRSVLHAVERDQGYRVVRPGPGLGQVLPPGTDREDPSPSGHHSTVPQRGPRMKDVDVLPSSSLVQPLDGEPG